MSAKPPPKDARTEARDSAAAEAGKAFDARTQKIKGVAAKIEAIASNRIEATLPKALGLNPRRFIHTAISNFYRTPDLVDCDFVSIVVAILQAAQFGMELDGINAALVPYFEKEVRKAQFVPMYQGLLGAVTRSGAVAVVRPPRAHFEGDHWRYELGLNEILEHIPADDPSNQTWDKLRHVYCVALMRETKDPAFVVLPKLHLIAIKNRSRAKNGPWATDPIPMALKTAVRNLAKYLPKAAEDSMLAKLIHHDELIDADVDEGSELEEELRSALGAQPKPAARRQQDKAIDVLKREQREPEPAQALPEASESTLEIERAQEGSPAPPEAREPEPVPAKQPPPAQPLRMFDEPDNPTTDDEVRF